MSKSSQFWGSGWSFPPTFERGESTLKVVHNEENINQSIDIVLNTQWGERSMLPLFGSNLNSFTFRKLNSTLEGELIDSIKTAILNFEPRIQLTDIDLTTTEHEGLIAVHIVYIIKKTNTRHNHVYPFYLKEATNLTIKHFEDRIK